MRKFIIITLIGAAILAACAPAAAPAVEESRLVTIYKLPT